MQIPRCVKRPLGEIVDLIDSAFLKVSGRHDTAPISLRRHVAPLDQFETTAEEYIAYFKLLGGLTMGDSILDIGCRPGRFAARLTSRPHYQRSFVTDAVARAGLQLEAVHNGAWSRLHDYLSFQDIVIVSNGNGRSA